MPRTFDRYVPVANRSFALRAYNRSETEINEHFWSFVVIAEYSKFIARKKSKTNPRFATQTLFRASGPDASRIPLTVSDWLAAQNELENWLRLSALSSASSFLEIYLRQVTRTALMSDPMCRFGFGRRVDGIVFLKNGQELPFADEHAEITKGDWLSRVAAFKRIFGDAPGILSSNIKALEKIRKLRNNFAHGFGRETQTLSPTTLDIAKADRLSQQTFIKYIENLSKTAAAIDDFLLTRFIGSFEILYFYHEWKSQARVGRDRGLTEARAFQKGLHRDGGVSLPQAYCQSVINFYAGV